MKTDTRPLCIDLFAGAGGASLGMSNAGFEVVGVELDKFACATHQSNSRMAGECIRADCTKLPLRKNLTPDCVWASPPCQDYSSLNPKSDKDSKRNYLVVESAKMVVYLNAKTCIFENVPPVMKSWQWAKAKSILTKAGYNVRDYLLDAVNYGVPQYRERAFLSASRIGPAMGRPEPTHGTTRQIETILKNKGKQTDGSFNRSEYKAALRWKEAHDENQIERSLDQLRKQKRISVLELKGNKASFHIWEQKKTKEIQSQHRGSTRPYHLTYDPYKNVAPSKNKLQVQDNSKIPSTTSGKLMPKEQEFILRGVIPNPQSPSAALLQLDIDLTDLFSEKGTDYLSWKQTLEDLLNAMDIKYARVPGRLKGRGVDASYRTFNGEIPTKSGKPKKKTTRSRILTVMPYPSVFASRLSQIRAEFYDKIKENNGQVLSSEQVGMRKSNVYFLLEEDAAKLKAATDILNKDIQKLSKEIKDFEATQDFARLINYLKKEIPEERWSRRTPIHTNIHDIYLNFTPLPISKQLVDSFMDQNVKEEVKKVVTKQVEKIAESFQKRLAQWMGQLTQTLLQRVTVSDMQEAQKTLGEIKDQAEKYQLTNVVGKQIDVCEALLNAIGSEDQAKVEEASKKVAETLNFKYVGDPKAALTHAAIEMQDISPEAKALIASML